MSKDRRKGWLATLEEGDDVIIKHHGYGRDRKTATVTRITPTGIIRVQRKGYELSYRPGGQERGKSYPKGSHLEPASEEALYHIEIKDKRRKVKNHVHRHIGDYSSEKNRSALLPSVRG